MFAGRDDNEWMEKSMIAVILSGAAISSESGRVTINLTDRVTLSKSGN